MKLAISNIAWGQEDDVEMYKYIAQSGYTGLEIAPTRLFDNPYNNLDGAKTYRESIKTMYGLDVVSMQSICFGREEQIFGEEAERETLKIYIKQATNFAQAIGCNNMVFGSPKNRNIGEGQHDLALSFFTELGYYAASSNTVLALEPNPEIYGTNFLNKTSQALTFVNEANCEGLMVNLDFGTIIENGEDINVIAENIRFINHVHISEPFLETIKQRPEHKILAGVLKKAGYANYVSIEMKNQNDINVVKEVMLYVKNIFHDS